MSVSVSNLGLSVSPRNFDSIQVGPWSCGAAWKMHGAMAWDFTPTHTGSVSPPRDEPGDSTSCGRNSVMGEQRSEGTTAMFPKHLGSRTGREARRAKEAWRRGVSDGQDMKEEKWGHLERRNVLMWL